MKVKVIILEAEEGGYTAEVPALPGCCTEGDSKAELVANLREAVEGILQSEDSPLQSGEGWHEEEIDL
jgi:predicted RNase H-like HicB family nuclease